MTLLEVAKLSEIPIGSKKQVDVSGQEILLVNIEGNIYAVDDRCGHMNAPLSMGGIQGNAVECALHHARFDVTTGKTLKEGHMGGLSGAVISRTKTGGIMDSIKTHDLRKYEVVIEGDAVKIRFD
jgi:nitrite reductase/ring-hydroxylating ferredoxin subunit